MPPTASIVIPAHNEESVIGGLLASILSDAEPGEFAVYVACNGCTDRTAAVAAGFPGVTVLEIPVASKAAALNAGDEAAGPFLPRLYLPAAAGPTTDAVRAAAVALTVDRALAAAPRLRVRTEGRPYLVRGYYDIWIRRPWVTDKLVGSGFYGVSKRGRERFDRFPDILNDDAFVRSLFPENDRVTADAEFTIEAPRSTAALIRAKTRVRSGNTQFAAWQAAPPAPKARGGSLTWLPFLTSPSDWLPLCGYAGVTTAIRLLTLWRRRTGTDLTWSQDRTTRAG
jgi:hypothetical protein